MLRAEKKARKMKNVISKISKIVNQGYFFTYDDFGKLVVRFIDGFDLNIKNGEKTIKIAFYFEGNQIPMVNYFTCMDDVKSYEKAQSEMYANFDNFDEV